KPRRTSVRPDQSKAGHEATPEDCFEERLEHSINRRSRHELEPVTMHKHASRLLRNYPPPGALQANSSGRFSHLAQHFGARVEGASRRKHTLPPAARIRLERASTDRHARPPPRSLAPPYPARTHTAPPCFVAHPSLGRPLPSRSTRNALTGRDYKKAKESRDRPEGLDGRTDVAETSARYLSGIRLQFRDDVLEGGNDLCLVDLGLPELQAQIEGLRGRSVLKDIRLRSARTRSGSHAPCLFARRRGLAVARQLLDEGDHFFGCLLPNYL